jgi:two-component system NtrC family sensor kinase
MAATSLSLQARIVSLVVFIVAVILLLSTYLDLKLSEKTFGEEMKERAVSLARELAASIGTRRELEDPNILSREMEEITKVQRTIHSIDIFTLGPTGPALIASAGGTSGPRSGFSGWHTVRTGAVVASLDETGGRRLWDVTAPVRLAGEVVGAITVKFSLEAADRHAAKERRQSLAIMVVSSILIVGVLGLYLQRNVSWPIRTLMRTMARAEGGDLGAEARLERDDELGQLARGFNRMLRKIKESHEENAKLLARIEGFNRELKAEVEKATQELATRHEELRQAHAMLFEVQRQLSRTERLVMAGQLAAMMAHEIGTPLHSISGHVQLLLKEGDLKEEAVDRLKIVETQIGRVVEILQALLTASAPAEPVFKPVEVNYLVIGLLNLIAPVLLRRGIVVSSAFTPDSLSVIGDAGQLQQVFLNLIANALDAMPDGGTLRVASGATTRDHGPGSEQQRPRPALSESEFTEVSIADTGRGIAPEHLGRIFEPFFTTKEVGKGTGLGLSICQRIVKAHGGRIEVKSAFGAGTTFTVVLPLSKG